MLLSPLSDCVEITAYVPRVEIDIGARLIRVEPDLAKYAQIDRTH